MNVVLLYILSSLVSAFDEIDESKSKATTKMNAPFLEPHAPLLLPLVWDPSRFPCLKPVTSIGLNFRGCTNGHVSFRVLSGIDEPPNFFRSSETILVAWQECMKLFCTCCCDSLFFSINQMQTRNKRHFTILLSHVALLFDVHPTPSTSFLTGPSLFQPPCASCTLTTQGSNWRES